MAGAEDTVSTRIVVQGGSEVAAEMARLQRLQDVVAQVDAAQRRSAAPVLKSLREQTVASNRAAQQLDILSGSASKAARGFGVFAPALKGSALQISQMSAAAGDLVEITQRTGPALDNLSKSLMRTDGWGNKWHTTASRMIPTMGGLAVAAGAVAAAFVAGKAIATLADDFNRVEFHAARLQSSFEATTIALEQQQRALALTGKAYGTAAEAVRAMADFKKAEAAAVKAVTDAVMKGDAATVQSLDRLVAMRDAIGEMTDGQLLRYRDALGAAADAARAGGEEIDETAQGTLRYVEILTRADEMLAQSKASFERQTDATHASVDAARDLADQLRVVYDQTSLSAKGFEEVAKAGVEWNRRVEEGTAVLDEGLNGQLERLGVNLDDAKTAFERAAETGETFAKALEKVQGGLDSRWTVGVASQMQKALADQTARWKKEQDERAAYEKKSIADVTAEYSKRWGIVIDESAVYWNTQFDKAAVSMVARTKGLLASAGAAMASMLNNRSNSGGGGGGSYRSSGGGGGGSSSGESSEDEAISRAHEIRRRMAALKRKEDELRIITSRFSKKGGYKAEVEKRQAQLAELRDEIDKLKGGKGSKFARSHGALLADKEDRDILKMAKDIRSGNKDQRRAADGIQRAVGKLQQVVAAQQQTAAATVDLRELARRSGMTQAEMARYLAGMAERSVLPSSRAVYQGADARARSGTNRTSGPRSSGRIGSPSPAGSNS